MKKSLMLTMLGAALVVPAHAASVIIGDFETAALDGWGSDGGPGSPTLAQSTVGVTHGANSLASTVQQGGFWGPSTGNLITAGDLAVLQTATNLSYDVTMNNADLNGGTSGFSGFAQDNEMYIQIFANAGGTLPSGINAFIQVNWTNGGISDSSGQSAQWNGVDGTRHMVWDLTKFKLNDPTGGGSKTVAQFLTDHPDVADVKLGPTEQVGGGTGNATMYFDNVTLNSPVPEPASVIALGLGALALVRRRRAR